MLIFSISSESRNYSSAPSARSSSHTCASLYLKWTLMLKSSNLVIFLFSVSSLKWHHLVCEKKKWKLSCLPTLSLWLCTLQITYLSDWEWGIFFCSNDSNNFLGRLKYLKGEILWLHRWRIQISLQKSLTIHACTLRNKMLLEFKLWWQGFWEEVISSKVAVFFFFSFSSSTWSNQNVSF